MSTSELARKWGKNLDLPGSTVNNVIMLWWMRRRNGECCVSVDIWHTWLQFGADNVLRLYHQHHLPHPCFCYVRQLQVSSLLQLLTLPNDYLLTSPRILDLLGRPCLLVYTTLGYFLCQLIEKLKHSADYKSLTIEWMNACMSYMRSFYSDKQMIRLFVANV